MMLANYCANYRHFVVTGRDMLADVGTGTQVTANAVNQTEAGKICG